MRTMLQIFLGESHDPQHRSFPCQDEENQAAIGRILPAILKHSQVICVSHHARFQRQAPHRISVLMENGCSIVQTERSNSLQQR